MRRSGQLSNVSKEKIIEKLGSGKEGRNILEAEKIEGARPVAGVSANCQIIGEGGKGKKAGSILLA